MQDTAFFTLRNRAFDLADSGHFKHWDEVAVALRTEGFLAALISRLGGDKGVVMMITRCCDQARAGA